MDRDWETKVRLATFEHLRRLREDNDGAVPSGLLEERLLVDGVPIAIMSRQKGIHKPAELDAALTVKTSWTGTYDDRMDTGEMGIVHYHYRDPMTESRRALQGATADNRAVRRAMANRLPVAYLMGVEKGWYLPFAPVNVIGDDQAAREFAVDLTELAGIDIGAGGLPDLASEAPARQYQARTVQFRVHQARFRQMVLRAYQTACGMCSLKHATLLDAAHIVEDAGGGLPEVSNGIALCKIHHAAFDRHILGIRPDTLELHVRQDILDEVDGPMLRHGLQSMHGRTLRVPRRNVDRPSAASLESRWQRFTAA